MPGALGLVSCAGVAVAAAADLLLGPVNDAQMQHHLSMFLYWHRDRLDIFAI